MLTSSRFLYQDLRGLRRSLFSDLPVSVSQVHLTSWAVNGLPSCHLTPWRSGKVSSVPSSLHDQLTARSGTIELHAVLWHDPDAQFYESYVCGAERNYGGYCNSQLDELID